MKISSLISIARISIFMVIVSITLSSCYVNRHTVGNGPVGKESGRIYSRGKQVYLFGGLWAVLDSAPTVPPQGDYQFKCSTNLVDIFIATLTFGLVTTRTLKIKVRKDHPALKRNYVPTNPNTEQKPSN